jgi:hypothetical protein
MNKTNRKVNSESRFQRINITIRKEQHDLVVGRGLSLSTLIRDLIDDRFSSNKVILNLSPEGKKMYDVIVGSFGVHDSDLEPVFIKALEDFMEKRIELLSKLKDNIKEGHDK